MQEKTGLPALAADLAFALGLLKASDALYRELLAAVEDHVDEDGTADLEALLSRFNTALRSFAPRDREIGRLLSRFDV